MNATRILTGFLILCFLLSPETAFSKLAKREDFEKLFATAVENSGDQYTLAVRQLVDHGKENQAFLTRKSTSENWRESFLAKAILLKIKKPEFVTQVRSLLATRNLAIVDGKLAVKRNPNQTLEKEAEKNYYFFTREAIPLLVDKVRSTADPKRDYRRTLLPAAMCFEAPELAPVLFNLYPDKFDSFDYHYFSELPEQVAKALVKLGPQTVPALEKQLVAKPIHPAPPKVKRPIPLADPNDPFSSPVTLEDRIEEAKRQHKRQIGQANHKQIQKTNIAAMALAEIGNAQSAEIMIKHLKESELGSQSKIQLCRAIGRLSGERGANVLFETLTDFPPSNISFDDYFEVRSSFIEMGELAKTELKKQLSNEDQTLEALKAKAIATGILFEIENPKQVKAFFGKLLSNYFSDQEERNGRYEEGYGGEEKKTAEKRLLGGRKLVFNGSSSRREFPTPPAELAFELGVLSDNVKMLKFLERHSGPSKLAMDWLAASALDPNARDGRRDVFVIPIAKAGGSQSVDVLCKLLKDYPVKEPFSFLQAAIEIEDRSAVKILDTMLETGFEANISNSRSYWKKEKKSIENLKLVFESSTKLRGDLLAHRDPRIQLASAVQLIQKKEPKSIPVVFDTILEVANVELDESFGRSRFPAMWLDKPVEGEVFSGQEMFEIWDFFILGDAQTAIVTMGEAAIPEIEAAKKLSADKQSALLAKLLTFRIRQPQEYTRLIHEINKPVVNSRTRGGPSEEDRQFSAERLAEALSPEKAWFLEAHITFCSASRLDDWQNIHRPALEILKQK